MFGHNTIYSGFSAPSANVQFKHKKLINNHANPPQNIRIHSLYIRKSSGNIHCKLKRKQHSFPSLDIFHGRSLAFLLDVLSNLSFLNQYNNLKQIAKA